MGGHEEGSLATVTAWASSSWNVDRRWFRRASCSRNMDRRWFRPPHVHQSACGGGGGNIFCRYLPRADSPEYCWVASLSHIRSVMGLVPAGMASLCPSATPRSSFREPGAGVGGIVRHILAYASPLPSLSSHSSPVAFIIISLQQQHLSLLQVPVRQQIRPRRAVKSLAFHTTFTTRLRCRGLQKLTLAFNGTRRWRAVRSGRLSPVPWPASRDSQSFCWQCADRPESPPAAL